MTTATSLTRMRCIVLALAVVTALAGCGNAAVGEAAPGPHTSTIEALTDCTQLQAEFDAAMDRAERFDDTSALWDENMGYAEIAMARMDSIGCGQ